MIAEEVGEGVRAGREGEVERLDVVVIGAGVTGLYALYRLRELGFSVRVFEEAGGVGGVWYWNCYPGCRFDTYSPTYSYSFSQELLDEWDWKETFSAQADTERYLNLVADKFDLRRDIRCNARVASATYDERDSTWLVELEDGGKARCRFLVAAVGGYSSGYVPDIPGLETFEGIWVHTGRWPRQGMDLQGKRVAVVGTGATGVQVVPEVAKVASRVTVFQRTANYCMPLDNEPIDAEGMREIRDNYQEIFQLCLESPFLVMERPDPRSGLEFSREERLAVYEAMWKNPGVSGKSVPLYFDVRRPGPINAEYTEFVKGKIRERIHDPALAEKLVPKDHMFGAKRPPGETLYYEAFNRDNVELVDVRENPIERITPTGIQTRDFEVELDVIVFATGWHRTPGPLLALDIRGEGRTSLKEKFAEGFRSYLFLQCAGFPNFFMTVPAFAGSYVRATEPIVDWIGGALCHLRDGGYRSMVPRPESEEGWTYPDRGGESPGKPSGAVDRDGPPKPRVPLLESELTLQALRREEAERGYVGYELR